MSQVILTPPGQRGSDLLVVVSTSHMKMCGREAAAEHERQAAAAGLASASGSLRRSSYIKGQKMQQMPRLVEQADDQGIACDVSLSYEEQCRSPVIRVMHHGNKTFLEQVVLDSSPTAGVGTRPLTYETARALSRSPSPRSRSSSPLTRPPTPIARHSSPKFRAMSPLQAARLSSYRKTSPSFESGAVRPSSALSAECRYSKKHGRAGAWSSARFPPSSRRGSTNTMLQIVEACNRCANITHALDAEESGSVAVQRRTEVMDVVPTASSPSHRGTSATAAIVAAAASAAGFQLEANGSEIQPCLDCLEEYVRRKRVEKRGSAETSIERADNEEAEVLTATTTTSRISVTEIKVPKRRSTLYSAAGGSKAKNTASGSVKSSVHHDAFSVSPQSPSPTRCPMCNACKSCGHTPPPGRK